MYPPYTAVIVDDEPFNTEILKKLLAQYKEVEIVGTATTVESAQTVVQALRPDLLFLDIQLRDKNGLDWYKQIKDSIDWDLLVVVVSSYKNYGYDACKLSVFNFIAKPIDYTELENVMNTFIKKKEAQLEQKNKSIVESNEKFMIATSNSDEIIHLYQIGFFEMFPNTNKWNVFLMNNKSLTLRCSTKANDILLYSQSFVQINRHQIINKNYLQSNKDGYYTLLPPFNQVKHLKYSRHFIKNIEQLYTKL
jgi:two-component system LytT family response regulator